MCNFLSALVLKNGDVRHHPMLDSHSDIVRYFKLPDTDQFIRHFAKVELTPKDDWLDASTWAWTVDEAIRPDWLDEVEAQAEAKLRAIASRMILRDGEHELIVDGCWIVGGTATVRDVRAGRIVRVQDSAQIRNVWDSAQIHGVRGSAQIRNVRGSAQIHDVWDSAQIRNVWDSAQIRNVGGSAQIHDVWDSAQIRNVGGSAQIHDVWDSAQIHDVRDSAQIRNVGGSAQIHDVWDSAQIHDVRDSAQIRNVRGSAQLDASATAHVVKD